MMLVAMIGGLHSGCTQAEQPKAEGTIQVNKQQTNDPNAVTKAGDPIIFDEIDRTDLAQVKRLVEAGADIERQGFGNQTPALRAASARQWDICLYLLNLGANATVADQGQYLAKVKDFLIQRNLDALNIPPKRVRELQSAGDWPPKALRGK
jgi:ankyrin repeat protein